ncbi:hypothetical protein [Spartinivicinus ruber]|uniref:hypothetical protein n=1 Tax=Spartinivicinus ruber TaxID=2683272 RepID=UPI0013D252BF|nr:hypothetical protein [Spartinivicinus ruber]
MRLNNINTNSFWQQSLIACTSLFFLRVYGQIVVLFAQPDWLPTFTQWYSGLIAYPILVLTQLLILMLMAVINYDNLKGQGYFVIESTKKRKLVHWFSLVYFIGMLIRYMLQNLLQDGWSNGLIPVIFHWVLAFYLYILTVVNHKKYNN